MVYLKMRIDLLCGSLGLWVVSSFPGPLLVVEIDILQAAFTVHFLTLLSVMNAVYVFWRKRHYRLFENPIDTVPSTPSAQRVRVDTSSDFSSSPLRFLSSMLAGETPESRAHPDPKRDVWELAVWDPTPLSLRMFCFFSPGHVLVYWLFLPTAREDLRPSTTVATTIVLVSLLSAQLAILRKYFSQQSKDTSVIHKEVLNEYDTKYVHPRTRPMVRDVGIQLSTSKGLADRPANHVVVRDSVDTYTPTILVNKGFHTRPNPNYVRHVDPEGSSRLASPPRILVSNNTTGFETPAHLRNASSPIRHTPGMWQSNFVNRATGDGGNLGIYSHAHSPLRKATSMHFADMHRSEERSAGPAKREGSPLKRSSASGERVGQGREHGDSFLRA